MSANALFYIFLSLDILSKSSGLIGVELGHSDDCGYIEKIPGDIRTESPWTAAIFYRNRYILSGVVIGPTTILTVFGGIYGVTLRGAKNNYSLPAPEQSFVAVGLSSSDLRAKDEFTQIVAVNYILPYGGQELDNKEYHFIMYRLKTPLNFKTPYVKPICLPFILRGMEDTSDIFLRNSGFVTRHPGSLRINFGGQQLRVTNLTRVSREECRSAFRFYYKGEGNHVTCSRVVGNTDVTKYDDGDNPSTPCLSHGSAAFFESNERFYLTGLLTLIPGKKRGQLQCTRNSLYFYAKLLDHLDWLRFNVRCAPNEFPCAQSGLCIPLHATCTESPDCPDSSDENPILCTTLRRCGVDEYMCGIQGPCISQEIVCDHFKDCPHGQDESRKMCLKDSPSLKKNESHLVGEIDIGVKRIQADRNGVILRDRNEVKRNSCIPLPVSEGVEFVCRHPTTDRVVNCTGPPTRTVVTGKCADYYSSKYRQTSIKMVCGEDGLWSVYKPFSCQANCGIISNDLKGFIYKGEPTTRMNAFPWYAAVFIRDRNSQQFKFKCGASLIEKKVLLTAAHCLPHEGVRKNRNGSEVRKGQIKIVLAPLSSIFDENLGDELAKIFDVTRVWTAPKYNSKTLVADIALIELDRAVEYGQFIRPVCYLSRLGTELELENRTGKIAGFGYTEKNELSSFLQFANIAIVSRDNCVGSNHSLPPPATFCGGPLNVSAPCFGDSGGGLVLPERKSSTSSASYILKGIVSAMEGGEDSEKKCRLDNYAIFTHVESYADWIIEKLEIMEDEQ